MNESLMQFNFWHDNNRKIPKGSHAIFGASKYHWVNYSIEKMIDTYTNEQASKIGTELHEMVAMLIKHKTKLPDIKKTMNMYVNDCIFYNLKPEVLLYYSDIFYGTSDAIGLEEGILRIFDFKSGKTKASFKQLEIYAAFFCLEYDLNPSLFSSIDLRLYQNDEIFVENPSSEVIVPIMDKIVVVNKMIQKIKEGYEP